MGLEVATYISDLNAAYPTSSDPKSQGDDHIRILKSALKATFPNINGVVLVSLAELNKLTGATATTAEINNLSGVTSSIQGQFASMQTQVDAKAPIDSPAFTGAPSVPTAAPGTANTQAANTAFVAALVTATAFSPALPGQAGNAGKFIMTDGTNASWSYVPPPPLLLYPLGVI